MTECNPGVLIDHRLLVSNRHVRLFPYVRETKKNKTAKGEERDEKERVVQLGRYKVNGGLLLLRQLATAGLLSFQVLVKKVEGLFVRLCASHDREHALARLIVRSLCDRDACTRASPNLGDLGSTATNDASNHVCGDADVLRLDFFAIFRDKRVATVGVGAGSSTEATASRLVTEVGAVAGPVKGTTAAATAAAAASSVAVAGNWSLVEGSGPDRRANCGVVEHGAGTSLPIVDKTFADFPDGLVDAFRSALHFNDSFGRLGKHFLLRDHANTRCILDVLDLQALASDDGTHLVVGDKKANS